MPLRPSRWVIHAPIAVLPFLAALVLEGRGLQDDLARRATESLAGAGANWARIAVSGRDVTLSGDAPGEEQRAAAVAAVNGTYGVRRVQDATRVAGAPAVQP